MIDTTDVNEVIAAIEKEVGGSVHEGGVHVGFFEEKGNRSGDIRKTILSARRKLSLAKKNILRLVNDIDYNQGLQRDYKFGDLPTSSNQSKKNRILKSTRISDIIKNTKNNKTEKETNPQIAFWNHYGSASSKTEGESRNTPPRPFLDIAIDKRTNELSKFVEDILKKNYNTDDLLKLIGERATHYIQKEIIDLRTPPLSEATIRKKLSRDPLIDTGEMLRSVTHKKIE